MSNVKSAAVSKAGAERWRGLVLPVALLVSWEVLARFGLVNKHLLVPPARVLEAAFDELAEGQLVSPLLFSVARDLGGVLLGSLLGVGIGGLMGLSRTWDRLLGPSVHALKQVAIFAWVPLMSVWLGTGELAKVVFIALAAFYPVALNTFEGVRSVARQYVEVAHVFRFSRLQVVRKVVFPAARPSIVTGMQLALVYGWLATIGAEYLLAAAPGIGNLMIDGREQFKMDKVLLGVVMVGVVGFALSAAFSKLQARWVRPSASAT